VDALQVSRLIDLNADAGESFGRWRLGSDRELMPLLTSVSVACGFHAGDPATMRESVRQAKAAGVALGAHPALPDLLGFGRRAMAVGEDEIVAYCAYQIGALVGIARLEDVVLAHVKLHGALYAMVAKQPSLARDLAEALQRVAPSLIIVLPGGDAASAAAETGARIAVEAFVDLDYDESGVPIIQETYPERDPDEVAQRAVDAVNGVIRARSGLELAIDPDTLCIHGDIPNAVEVATAIVDRFEREGIELRPLAEVIARRRPSESTALP
jgi:UPF0271 protein